IDEAPARSFWNVRTWTAVPATCGMVAIAISAAVRMRSGGAGVTAPTTPTTESPTVPSLAQRQTPMLTPTAQATKTMTKPGAVRAAARETKLEVLVPPDQLNAIRQLMNAVRTGAVKEMAPAPEVIDPVTGELIQPKPLEIPLITIEPLPGVAEGRSGGS